MPGQLVAVDGLIPCGRCWWCERHLTPLCASTRLHRDARGRWPGRLPVRPGPRLHPRGRPCRERHSCPRRTDRRGRPRSAPGPVHAGESVVVFGAGMVGIATVAAARAFGARSVTLVGNSSARRDLASALGADRVVDSAEDDLIGWLRDHHSGRGPDLVIEASGDAGGCEPGDHGATEGRPDRGRRVPACTIPGGPVRPGCR